MVRLVVEKRADWESVDGNRCTLFLDAAKSGGDSMLRLPIKKVAGLDAKASWGQTPLSMAAADGHETID